MKRSYSDFSAQQPAAFFSNTLHNHHRTNLHDDGFRHNHLQQQSAHCSPPNPILQSFHFLQKDTDNSPDSSPNDSAPVVASPTHPPSPHHHHHHGGESVETTRRPRGRPPGSKNKPKPPKQQTYHDPQKPSSIMPHSSVTTTTMTSRIFEIPAGVDIVRALSTFAENRALGICVLSGSGAVTNVTLQQGSPSPAGSTVTFHGRFDILSLSATFFASSNASNNGVGRVFNAAITLAGPQGQVVGGSLVGPLFSSGTVHITAATFAAASHHRLPDEENIDEVGAPERDRSEDGREPEEVWRGGGRW
uniref:PPC domain-containing protein n=1 Tax=Kalanchoe fedtschenkoi TaxID=63787 RepID=A0A7N1A1F7_KALFE